MEFLNIAMLDGLGVVELVFISMALGGMAIWVWMLIDCAVHEPNGGVRAAWIIVVAITGIFGALVYLFARKIPRRFGAGKPAAGGGR